MADRVEREIEEILRKIDDIRPERSTPASRIKRPNPQPKPQPRASEGRLAHTLARISLTKIMMWSLFFAMVMFFARAVPGATWLLLGSIIVFATAFLLSRLAGSSQPQVQKRWRGEVLDLSGPSWPERVRDWLKGRRKR